MYTIGIDLGGTNIVASVVDDEYKIIGTSKTPTNAPRSADEIFDDISEVCEEAVKADIGKGYQHSWRDEDCRGSGLY